jgi:hypothetical protein
MVPLSSLPPRSPSRVLVWSRCGLGFAPADPVEVWSKEDWAAHEASERLYQPRGDQVVLPPPAYELPRNFGGLHGHPKAQSDAEARRRRQADRALRQLGIRR